MIYTLKLLTVHLIMVPLSQLIHLKIIHNKNLWCQQRSMGLLSLARKNTTYSKDYNPDLISTYSSFHLFKFLNATSVKKETYGEHLCVKQG